MDRIWQTVEATKYKSTDAVEWFVKDFIGKLDLSSIFVSYLSQTLITLNLGFNRIGDGVKRLLRQQDNRIRVD